MGQFAILRFEKHKGGAAGGIESHHERKKEKYDSNPDIDVNRSKHNIHIIQPQGRYRQEIDGRIDAAGCKLRRDSIKFVDTLITASPEFFKGKKYSEVKRFFEQAVDFIIQRVGQENVFSAVVHTDEKTPHLHLCFTPITNDGRLSAKEVIGNRTQLTKWQDAFFAHMVKTYPDLERGEPASETGRRHIPTRVLKQTVSLTKKAKRIQEVLEGINPINASKRRDELASLLLKFFPEMEDFQSELKKYGKKIDWLEQKNAELSEKVAGDKTSISKELKNAKLESDYRYLLRVAELIPPDIRQEIENQLKTGTKQQAR